MTTHPTNNHSLRHQLRTRDGLLLRPLVWLLKGLRPVIVWGWIGLYSLVLAWRIARGVPGQRRRAKRPAPRTARGGAFIGDRIAN
jgi:hypothetical protein